MWSMLYLVNMRSGRCMVNKNKRSDQPLILSYHVIGLDGISLGIDCKMPIRDDSLSFKLLLTLFLNFVTQIIPCIHGNAEVTSRFDSFEISLVAT